MATDEQSTGICCAIIILIVIISAVYQAVQNYLGAIVQFLEILLLTSGMAIILYFTHKTVNEFVEKKKALIRMNPINSPIQTFGPPVPESIPKVKKTIQFPQLRNNKAKEETPSNNIHINGDMPRKCLRDLFQKYGKAILEEPHQVSALLNDYCRGEYKKERTALVNALNDGIPDELLKIQKKAPNNVIFNNLKKRLMDNYGLTEDLSSWAVESWVKAIEGFSESKQYTPIIKKIPNETTPKSDGPDELYARGINFSQKNQLQEALTIFEQVTIIDPSNYKAWNSKGVTLAKLQRYQEANDAFYHSLKINPNYHQAIENHKKVQKFLNLS